MYMYNGTWQLICKTKAVSHWSVWKFGDCEKLVRHFVFGIARRRRSVQNTQMNVQMILRRSRRLKREEEEEEDNDKQK